MISTAQLDCFGNCCIPGRTSENCRHSDEHERSVSLVVFSINSSICTSDIAYCSDLAKCTQKLHPSKFPELLCPMAVRFGFHVCLNWFVEVGPAVLSLVGLPWQRGSGGGITREVAVAAVISGCLWMLWRAGRKLIALPVYVVFSLYKCLMYSSRPSCTLMICTADAV